MDDKIKDFKVLNGENRSNSLADAIRELRENIGSHIEYIRLLSKIRREEYLSLREEGFSEKEALELCKRI